MQIDIKGQVFDVLPEILEGILGSMSQTAADGLEHGFLMCDTLTGIAKGEECTGTACSIHLKGCEGIGPVVGNFHSHPTVISFSLNDYLGSLERAQKHPQHKQLMCVTLKESGVRCKAVTQLPPPKFKVPLQDTDENREKVKPFFTPKVSISKVQIKELLAGTPWEGLSPEEQIIAIDEGDVVVPTELFGGIGIINIPGKGQFPLKPWEELKALSEQKKQAWAGIAKAMGLPDEEVGQMPTKSLVEIAQEYINEPTGKYPWQTKTVTKSVKLPTGQVGLELVGMPTLESDETQFVPTEDVETPDPSMIHYGEVAQYISALSPIILTKEKDEAGKWKILDGRHRVAAWRAAGYKQIPVVFSTEKEYK